MFTKFTQKDCIETWSCLKITCRLGWGRQVLEKFVSFVVFSELLKMYLAVLLGFDL